MKLAPRMIQSMEVLQLPLLALQEKIEAELVSNPVLEKVEPTGEEQGNEPAPETSENDNSEETSEDKEFVVKEDSGNVEDFQRLDSIEDTFGDYMDRASSFRVKRSSSEPDKKLEALQNTAALDISLNDHLIEQWRLVEAEPKIKKAGSLIIDYIDAKGYLAIQLEQLHNKDKYDISMDDFHQALGLVQKLDPIGVGARDLKECLLIQMTQWPEDMSFESRLVGNHLEELLENKLPQIAKKMKSTVEQINSAITKLSRLDTSPGLQIGRDYNHPISADVVVESNADDTGYDVFLTDTRIPQLRVNKFYATMAKDRKLESKTRDFLQGNIRSAQWLMDAIEQRKNTLLKVARAIVKHQKDFFDKGQLHLKPLPMATIADEVGVHIATISRAVAGKYVQCPQGVLPLRGFFSGGTEDSSGEHRSWDAIRANLQQIVDAEDKSKPLNDDEIRDKLIEAGVKKIARRTIAKYRKLMNIPSARFRKKY